MSSQYSERPAVLAVQFGVELATLLALAYWGWRTGGVALALVAVLATSGLWAAFGSPNAPRPLPRAGRVGLRVLLLAAATAALATAVGPAVAAGFGVVAAVTVAVELRGG